MKLTKSMLMKIIAEEVKAIKESATDESYTECEDFAQSIANMWIGEYDPADPVMAEFGEDAWVAQCHNAAEELTEECNMLVSKINEKLHNGEYGLGF